MPCRVVFALFRLKSGFYGFHVHRWQVVSSQGFRPHFDPIALFYIINREVTRLNQQQGMKMRMCHHFPSFPLVTSVVLKKPATPDLNRLVSISRFHESFMCFKVSRNSVTGGFSQSELGIPNDG